MTHHEADTRPSKRFFVSMLTRDIDLTDAILDLVDNSLDGALRMGADEHGYAPYRVEVLVGPDEFWISDNCGGIPRDIAAQYAFRMGRESGDPRDAQHATIGMYGIGMKRALFKMGDSAVVDTNHEGDRFLVRITPEWLASTDWAPLPFEAPKKGEGPQEPGTTIFAENLHPGVSAKFGSEAFVAELKKAFSDHFTLFLQRGFTIVVNGEEVQPTLVRVLLDQSETGPKPFFAQHKVGSTTITLTIGLNAGISSKDSESDAANFTHERASPTAGWSIFCNDRAIVIGDKSRLTGWGDGVPMFHPQFNMITGVIEFSSNDATDLPVTTTKRALDTAAEAWLVARPLMREAMKVVVGHTNRWKNHPKAKQAPAFSNARQVSLEQVAEHFGEHPELLSKRRGAGGAFFDPVKKGVLPEAPKPERANHVIRFSRPRDQVRAVGVRLLDDAGAKPGDVGAAAFDHVFGGIDDE